MKNSLPETGLVRLRQLLGTPNSNPPVPPLIPISRSTLWLWVKNGQFPKPLKLGPRTTAWRVEDIRAFIESRQVAA